MASSAILSVDAFQRKRIKTFSAINIQQEQDDSNSKEYGSVSVFEEFEGIRFLAASMSVPPPSSGGQGTNNASQSNNGSTSPPPDTTPLAEEVAPIDPLFNQPEGDEWLPWDVNVDMCTSYDDYFLYTGARETLLYDYSVQVSDTSNTEFAAELTKIIRQSIHDAFCPSNRLLKLEGRRLEDGNLIGFQVHVPKIGATACADSTESGCLTVVGDIDYAIGDQPGNASKEAILSLVDSVISSYQNDNVIKIGDEDEVVEEEEDEEEEEEDEEDEEVEEVGEVEETVPENDPVDSFVDSILDKTKEEEEALPQENAAAVDISFTSDNEGTKDVDTSDGMLPALPENAKPSNVDTSKKSQDNGGNNGSKDLIPFVSIIIGCALIAIGAGMLIQKRRQNADNDFDSYGDSCIRCIQPDNGNVIINSLEGQMGRNSVDARVGSNQGLSTIHIRNAMDDDFDLEDVHICRSDPCPTCTRARKVFMTDV